MRRRPIPMLAFVMMLAGCALPAAPPNVNVSGRWIGTWSGHGVLEIPRDEETRLELVQRGLQGEGLLVMDGTLAAESVPVAIRNVGMTGVRVVFATLGDRVRVEHELGPELFAAELVVRGDRMRGHALGVTPYIFFDLVRDEPRAVSVPVAAAPLPPVALPPRVPLPVAPPPPPVIAPAPTTVIVTSPPPPTVIVTSPPPPPEPEPPRVAAPLPETPPVEVPSTVRTRPELRPVDFAAVPELRPIHFDFDSAAIRPGEAAILDANAEWLRAHPDQLVLIGGHCDERGTPEYNLALGERRARAVMAHLLGRGIAEERMTITSYGFERPVCTERTEACWAENRRVLLLVKPQ